jgi:hypothetical protein
MRRSLALLLLPLLAACAGDPPPVPSLADDLVALDTIPLSDENPEEPAWVTMVRTGLPLRNACAGTPVPVGILAESGDLAIDVFAGCPTFLRLPARLDFAVVGDTRLVELRTAPGGDALILLALEEGETELTVAVGGKQRRVRVQAYPSPMGLRGYRLDLP